VEEKDIEEAIKSGDCEVFIQIVEKYSKLLWVVVGGILSNVGTAEDIEECISDTYVNLWKSKKAFNHKKGSLKTLLTTIARRRALDRYRQLKKTVVIELDEDIASPDDDLFESITTKEMHSGLYNAIQTLNEPDKEILIRRYFFGEKPSIIADKTHLQVKEVENRLYQSKLKLRKQLIEKEII